MAAPVRERPAVAEQPPSNFEYNDDNEWDVGIGDLIIDLDADIAQSDGSGGGSGGSASGGGGGGGGGGSMASAAGGAPAKAAKLAVEHSATVHDKGLKMKIKRTKPGTKTSEAKHEIVKSNEQNGGEAPPVPAAAAETPPKGSGSKHGTGNSTPAVSAPTNSSKRGSSGHRRDKVKDKHGSEKTSSTKSQTSTALAPAGTGAGAGVGVAVAVATGGTTMPASNAAPPATCPGSPAPNAAGGSTPAAKADVNGVVVVAPPRAGSATTTVAAATAPATTTTPAVAPAQAAPTTPAPVQTARAPAFPASSGPGPPASPSATAPQHPVAAAAVASPATPASPASASAAPTTLPTTPSKADIGPTKAAALSNDDRPPPPKIKAVEPKEMADVCVGTSVGTITEPDCLGPCEPGTSVTLEGIVWHETEGGVLVVNVTWRGKTYVGTLLDCTRHDWAPPRFCDSPTSDLDARTPKGRGKRGRGAAVSSPGSDLSNFTETRSSVHSKLRNGGAKGRRGLAAQASGASNSSSTSGSGSGSNSGSCSGSGNGSPMSFPPPRVESNKRKSSRTGEEESACTAKKSKGATTPVAPSSPPPSPVLLECPEPNCCKKYKHINGLKYHQSHAHGSQDDDDTKDMASMSENDESNAEPPSPAATAKQDKIEVKEEATGADSADSVIASCVPESSSQVAMPIKGGACSPLPAAQTAGTPQQEPPSTPTPPTLVSAPPSTPEKVVKPGVLRFGVVSEENVFVANKGVMPGVATLRALSVTVPTPSQGPVTVPPPSVQTAAVSQPTVPPQTGVPPVVSFTFPLQLPQQPPPGHMAQGPLSQLNQMSPPAGPAVTPVPQANAAPVPSAPATQGPPGGPGPPGQHGLHVAMHSLPPGNQGPTINKIPQFKVKPTSALMPDDKSKDRSSKSSSHKKKIRKSPAGSPHPNTQPDQPFGLDSSGREDVQSPAYSDISDDAAPVLESEMADKSKVNSVDKKVEASQGPPHSLPPYFGIFPPYCAQSQPPYLVPSVQADGKNKEGVDKSDPKSVSDKEKKDGPPVPGEYSQKLLPQHYYPYGYGYPYNLEPYVAVIPMEDKNKDDKSPGPADQKPLGPQPSPIQVPNPNKLKTEPGIAKHQNENHQILKESIEMKNQMSTFIFSRQQPCQPGQPQPPTGQTLQQGPGGPTGPPCAPGHPGHQPPCNQSGPGPGQLPPNQSPVSQEEVRRYYLYADQRGLKTGPPSGPPMSGAPPGPPPGITVPTSCTSTGTSPAIGPVGGPGSGQGEPPPKATPPPMLSKQNLTSPSPKHKDKASEDKSKEEKVKQEGVKPTMETQGPPPPPTSLFSYVHHPNYLQGPPYGGLPFAPDPGHSMYRPINSLLVPPGAYGNNPYLHPQLHSQMQRYHAPEDLSRPQAGAPKALDILQHHANQFYSSHKIHELQERALKSPTPKTVSASASPSGVPVGPQPGGPPGGPGAPPGALPPTSTAGGPTGAPPMGKPSPAEGKDSRSPPPQRHVHTHHHTHVGLGYPILAGQYSSPYGAAVLASQQAAAVAASGISPYTPK